MQATLKPLEVQETKDIETTVAGIRSDKLKEKTASDAAKKGETLLQKASLNTIDRTLSTVPLSTPTPWPSLRCRAGSFIAGKVGWWLEDVRRACETLSCARLTFSLCGNAGAPSCL